VRSQRLWVVVVRRWLGGYASSRKPRTQGFQTTSLSSTRPVPEPQRSSPRRLDKAIITFTEGKCNRHLSAIRVHIQRRFGVVLTRGRIEQYLRAQGLKPFRPQKQPLLLPQQKKKRIKFARTQLSHDWRMTLFTDETEFLLHPKTTNKKNNVVWARRREDVPRFGGEAVFCQGACVGWSLCPGSHALIDLQGRPDGAQVPCPSEETKT